MNIPAINSTNKNQKVNFSSRLVKLPEKEHIFSLLDGIYNTTADYPQSLIMQMEITKDMRPYILLPEDVEMLAGKIKKGMDILLNRNEQNELYELEQKIHQGIDKQSYIFTSEEKKTERQIIQESGIYNWYESVIDKAKSSSSKPFEKAYEKIQKLTSKKRTKAVETKIVEIRKKLNEF